MEVSKNQIAELLLLGLGGNINISRQVLTQDERETLTAWRDLISGSVVATSTTNNEVAAISLASRTGSEGYTGILQFLDGSPSSLGYASLGFVLCKDKNPLDLSRFLPKILKGGLIGRCFYLLGLMLLNRRDILEREVAKLSCADDTSPLTMMILSHTSIYLGDPTDALLQTRDCLSLCKQLCQGCDSTLSLEGQDTFKMNMGVCQILKNMEPEALEEFSAASSPSPDLIANSIVARELSGDHDMAEESLKSLRAADPGHDLIVKMDALRDVVLNCSF
eukprot:GHVH01006727.1.p1 GENE.GHVH01006727.1~~GHVH01006727.1.p1  ORF type:complete len:278 (-),score=32.13 GHVH01006727.1:49-882(-)